MTTTTFTDSHRPDEKIIAEAVKMWAFMPFRRCWIGTKQGENPIFILKATAHTAGKFMRAGWTMVELKKDSQ
jgi:hypothetical protein